MAITVGFLDSLFAIASVVELSKEISYAIMFVVEFIERKYQLFVINYFNETLNSVM